MISSTKKQEEMKHIRNLLDAMRYEFGSISINNGRESPDFSITLSDGSLIGIEETQCCPSANQNGSTILKSFERLENVRAAFFDNAYLKKISKNRKSNILIYVTRRNKSWKHTVADYCDAIEKHLQYAIEPTTHPKPSTDLIEHINVSYTEMTQNIININYIARRDAIKAKELIKSIKNKELKRKDYTFNGPIWLCVFLPFSENRHPYEIEYDNECTKEVFDHYLKECGYKRIYITSELKDIDIKRIK